MTETFIALCCVFTATEILRMSEEDAVQHLMGGIDLHQDKCRGDEDCGSSTKN